MPSTAWPARLKTKVQLKLRPKTARRRTVRFALLASNVIILAMIAVFVLQNSHTNGQAGSALNGSTASTAAANPLDQVSSADIAVASSSNNVTAKPAVVATALKSRADIQVYTVQPGDTIPNLATKFGITSDSIRWSNGVSGDTVAAGTKLTIPPVTGIVYTVKDGDTADSIAAKFGANKSQILAYNDGEISGLQVGEQIIIPNAAQTATTAAGISAGSGAGGGTAFPWGSGPMYGFNGYDYGYCTWYVASQINVPGNWGNASSWAYYARASGWNVSSAPTVGSIAQKGGGEGHVAIVTAVNPDGSVQVRDMNGFAGWGRVGTGSVSSGFFQNFITH